MNIIDLIFVMDYNFLILFLQYFLSFCYSAGLNPILEFWLLIIIYLLDFTERGRNLS